LTHAARLGNLATEPDWSPNGRWISYDIFPHGDGDRSRIFKIRPNGSHRTNIDTSCTVPCLLDGFQQWSPNGKRIAFQRGLGPAVHQTNLSAIFVMRADGTHVRQITQKGAPTGHADRFADHAPTWSADAKRIAFERLDNNSGHLAIFTVRLDGNGLRRITPWSLDASQPDWSPDGRWIAFRTHEPSSTRGDIFLVHPNGTALHGITHGGGKWGSCSFSPDGREITASRSPGFGSAGNADVYVMNVDGSSLRDVTHSNPWESAPDWGARPS